MANDMRGITKRENSYRFTVSAGFDGNGKHVRKYTTFTPPAGVTPAKADKLAKEAYIEFENKCRGIKNLKENMRFYELVEMYFKEYAPNELKPATTYNYDLAVKTHVLPVFGNKKIKDIAVSDISTFLTTLNLKGSSCRKIKIIISSIFNYGVNQMYIKGNPCKGALYKKDKSDEVNNFYNKEEARKLLELTNEYSTFNTIIKLLLMTGMRSGECLGLSWEDIDMDNCVINIRHTLSYANGEWFLTEPKTRKSRRSIKMNNFVVELLKKHREKQVEIKEKFGGEWKQTKAVFTSPIGNYYDRSLLNSQFKMFLNKSNMHLITLHGLRHTNASLLIFNGFNIKAISDHLGHCNINITGDIYGHIFEEYRAKIAIAIECDLLG